jgi:hypothetical protein
MNIDDSLNEIFDLQPIEGDFISKRGVVIVPKDNAVENDVDYSRNNLYGLLQTGQEALESALEIAKQSENPRAFEVVGGLIKQLADINHQLLDVHIKRQKMDTKQVQADQATTITNNSIFVGSTAELNKFINNMNKGES